MLWKIRNERTIGEKATTKEQVKERWKKMMIKMIEEELGRINKKNTEKKRKEGRGDFLKEWGMTSLMVRKKDERRKIKDWGKDW